jgi:hypothetical protein
VGGGVPSIASPRGSLIGVFPVAGSDDAQPATVMHVAASNVEAAGGYKWLPFDDHEACCLYSHSSWWHAGTPSEWAQRRTTRRLIVPNRCQDALWGNKNVPTNVPAHKRTRNSLV